VRVLQVDCVLKWVTTKSSRAAPVRQVLQALHASALVMWSAGVTSSAIIPPGCALGMALGRPVEQIVFSGCAGMGGRNVGEQLDEPRG
jgi:hypothetical protein